MMGFFPIVASRSWDASGGSDVKDLDADTRVACGSDDTPSGTVGVGLLLVAHFVQAVLAWVDFACVTVTLAWVVTLQPNTIAWLCVGERTGALKVDRVPADLGEGVSAVVHVEAGNVWGPVTLCFVGGPPHTPVLGRDTRWVDIEVGGGAGPVVCAWNSQVVVAAAGHLGWNQHGLVTWEHRLAEGNLVASLVDSLGGTLALDTVVAVGDRLAQLTVRVTVQATVLRTWVGVGGDIRVPLSHQVAGLAGVLTV